jgi:hypothetical protein
VGVEGVAIKYREGTITLGSWRHRILNYKFDEKHPYHLLPVLIWLKSFE